MKDKVKRYLEEAQKIIDSQQQALNKLKDTSEYSVSCLNDKTLTALNDMFDKMSHKLHSGSTELKLSNLVYDEMQERNLL